jgi:hypothetical protein
MEEVFEREAEHRGVTLEQFLHDMVDSRFEELREEYEGRHRQREDDSGDD